MLKDQTINRFCRSESCLQVMNKKDYIFNIIKKYLQSGFILISESYTAILLSFSQSSGALQIINVSLLTSHSLVHTYIS